MEEINTEVIKEKFRLYDAENAKVDKSLKDLEGKINNVKLDLSKLDVIIQTAEDTNSAIKSLTATLKKDYVLKDICCKNRELIDSKFKVLSDRIKNLESDSRTLKWVIYTAIIAEVVRIISQ